MNFWKCKIKRVIFLEFIVIPYNFDFTILTHFRKKTLFKINRFFFTIHSLSVIMWQRKRFDCRRLLTRFWSICTIMCKTLKRGKELIIMDFIMSLWDKFISLFFSKEKTKNVYQPIIINNGNMVVNITILKSSRWYTKIKRFLFY